MGGASVLQMIMKYRWLKSLAAFVAAIVLSFVCAAPAFAASGSLKVVSQEGTHSYQAYKLFACDVNADGSVSNVSTAGCMPADFYADALLLLMLRKWQKRFPVRLTGLRQARTQLPCLGRL